MTLASSPLRGPLRKRESHLWARDPGDWYVEPRWCSERLFEQIPFVQEVIDPACGMGRIVESARAAGHCAEGWDLVDRGFPRTKVRDFLGRDEKIANIICNPPFGIAQEFVEHALELARYQVCMLLPANWIQGDRRSRWLARTPLSRVLFITPRPSMPPGRLVADGVEPGNGTTDYAWFCWVRHATPGLPTVGWLRRDP